MTRKCLMVRRRRTRGSMPVSINSRWTTERSFIRPPRQCQESSLAPPTNHHEQVSDASVDPLSGGLRHGPVLPAWIRWYGWIRWWVRAWNLLQLRCAERPRSKDKQLVELWPSLLRHPHPDKCHWKYHWLNVVNRSLHAPSQEIK
ncbi:uncharacterized protein LOC110441980 [Mizuhopecten yessoensis]|uniref:uncharacterized protein LOC110441980 n=1 Tax=Mizuhopecten yessoensis TaxID=6573 RepID=UPI000B45F7E7|nr:uncharacterized protein LOC110441980 [Mizuhopecten yessoensis]